MTVRLHTLLNQVQTSNKAHDKFVPRRDFACADHSRPSLSTALLGGWSSHLVLIRFQLAFPYPKQGLPRRGKLAFGRPKLAYGLMTALFHTFTFPQSQTLACLSANLFPSNFDSKAIWHFSASRFGCCRNPN